MTQTTDILTEGTALKQYLVLAKSNKGRACVALIEQALSNQNVFVFGELLDMPNVQALQQTEFKQHYDLLNIFTFGTYSHYISKRLKNKDNLPPLTPQMSTKLKQLSIVYLSTISKIIPYSLLQKELEISNLRELEDLVIDSIYQNIIRGKLDQKNKHLEIEFAIGRDVPAASIDVLINALDSWVGTSDGLLKTIGELMIHSDKVHVANRKNKEDLEKRVEVAKSQIKLEAPEASIYDSFEYSEEFSRSRKGMKTKGGKDHTFKRP
ncbi:proteasome component region PCI domain-containing protein [Cavenderia fasciculata]|uniref:Proteasome component region PCI domain-containing protein n=1 Tax=Cavenderia fasciculata TaxID=261658 RepID=F4PXD0_CACFS|nr:proteasome component region PCI domain-containing protein [Cavenderia fasciculata]EGG19440.1 proteasome component region PCI domain-containing protein [Cavenderia fasciculata]|eukprot:XP_004357734.1 proteasome component region PCI domain-containing protein [Cavenderia fasciculata]